MSTKKYSAFVLGASGLVGLHTIDLLLKDDRYDLVYAVSRKGIDREHSKLIQVLADFDSISAKISAIEVSHFFSCLGTTASKTPDKNEYYQIDHDYPLKTAQILKENGCQVICIVSSMSADSKSNTFYLKLKGKLEDDLIALGIESTNIFRPSLLKGQRREKRFMEKTFQALSPILDKILVGRFKNFRSISGSQVASAMIHIATYASKGVYIYKTEEIKKIS